MVNGDKNISVDSFSASKNITLSPGNNTTLKTIGGIEGLYSESNGRYIFFYSDGEQLIQIDAPEEQLIEKVMGK